MGVKFYKWKKHLALLCDCVHTHLSHNKRIFHQTISVLKSVVLVIWWLVTAITLWDIYCPIITMRSFKLIRNLYISALIKQISRCQCEIFALSLHMTHIRAVYAHVYVYNIFDLCHKSVKKIQTWLAIYSKCSIKSD